MKLGIRRDMGIPVVTALVAVGLVTVSLGPTEKPANAAIPAQFNAGRIIDDSKFYDANAMTQAQIQAFLNAKTGPCQNDLCLSIAVHPTTSQALSVSNTGNVRCGAYAGGGHETSAAIIFKIQQACGISAKVLLVTLEKERGLVSNPRPTVSDLKVAMGFGCPDTAPCDTLYFGFFNQVYLGAKQLNTYKASNFGRQPGIQAIQYNPNAACGAPVINVQNYATAALYNYTPYQPNTAALANLYGSGDGCSSYGNRNFWVFYSDWFGSPIGDPSGALGPIAVGNNSVTIGGWAVDADAVTAPLSIRVRGEGWTRMLTANGVSPDSASIAGAGTNHGYSATLPAAIGSQVVCVDAMNIGLGVDIVLGCQSVTVPTTLQVSRIEGTNRYDTAVSISRQNFTPGVPVVFVASGENFPDALSVVPAAAAQGAPVLLTAGPVVGHTIAAEIARLVPDRIVVIGGISAIPESVEEQLGDIAPVERISGENRYDTSLLVAEILGAARSGHAYIATGGNFPDAISAASAAGFQDAPLVLVGPGATTVPPSIADAFARWGVTQVTVVGGVEAVTDELMASVEGLPGVSTIRKAGSNRYLTSLAVNEGVFGAFSGSYVATGSAFSDGLTGGAVGGRDGKPLFISPSFCVPKEALASILGAGATSVTLLGGQQALTPRAAALSPC